ncbi:MAG: NAD-dependent epimerase/dehydratase family protein [Anaerolineae bacterium]|nr:NAD-dependent epimerase/dehydratase family protein [Anaerolineae bacterium]
MAATRHYLITGGAGFIGSNYVARLLARGDSVTILDNLSRKGGEANIEWLKHTYGENSFALLLGDIRDFSAVCEAVAQADVIVHLAGQVAVTTSVLNPREDFDVNAAGTLNVLEAARLSGRNPIVLYASTNKVYGGMEGVEIVEGADAYSYAKYPFGIPEEYPLDFHSPYGCSKGCGDQYVRDYFRIYGLPTVVLRQSCIYGPRQFGIEDQGWVAWFIIAAVCGKPVKIYGNGKQVRDILYIEDLLDAYDAAIEHIGRAAGQVFNIGGGAQNTLSVWRQFAPILESFVGYSIAAEFDDWRPGDQRIYVSDIRKAQATLNWLPKIGVKEGLRRLYDWVFQNRSLFR